jgi:hypothetical protein
MASEKNWWRCGELPLNLLAIGGKMDPAYAFEFTVGETYENEKGMFLVLSIAKDDMVIRWHDGEETQTSLEFQGRIQKRRQWEKTLLQEKTIAVKPAPKKAKASKRGKQAPCHSFDSDA